MRRLYIVGIIAGLLVVLGLAGNGGFEAPKSAEATQTTTTWLYPTSGGILASTSNPAVQTQLGVPTPCTNCYITNIVPDLVYQNDPDPINHPDGASANFNNNSLDGVWLHHMVIFDQCGAFNRVFASGNERTTVTFPAGYGFYENCASWTVNWHIHNSSNADRRVALKLVITYRTSETLTSLTPLWVDVSSSSTDSEYTVPEGYSDTQTGSGASGISNDYTSTMQGQIITIGGHIHDYGISVSMFNNRLNDYVCTSQAGYGTGSRYFASGGPGTPGHPASAIAQTLNQSYHEPGGSPDNKYHIQSMSNCTPTPAQSIICVGDVLRLHTQYNNTSGFPIFDAMGIISAEINTNMPDTNANGTIDACEDTDADGIKNSADNCPLWANANQVQPSWTIPAGDSDCDGFPDTVLASGRAPESFIGTVATQHCAANAAANNEPLPDAWPIDYNDDQLAGGADILKLGAAFNQHSPGPPYAVRLDLNGDGVVSGADVLKFGPFFNKRCA
jgi:Thrombospondin type 3 repeat